MATEAKSGRRSFTDVVVLLQMKEAIRRHGKFASYRELALALGPAFPQYKHTTLHDFLIVADRMDGTMRGFLERGELSVYVLGAICSGHLDAGVRRFLAEEAVARKMSRKQVEAAKKIAADERCLMGSALQRATGDTPSGKTRGNIRSITKQIEGLTDALAALGVEFRTKASLLRRLLPQTCLDKSKAHYYLLYNTCRFEQVLRDMLVYVEKMEDHYIKEHSAYFREKGAPAPVLEREKPYGESDEGGGGEEFDAGLHATGQVVPDHPDAGEGAERNDIHH